MLKRLIFELFELLSQGFGATFAIVVIGFIELVKIFFSHIVVGFIDIAESVNHGGDHHFVFADVVGHFQNGGNGGR